MNRIMIKDVVKAVGGSLLQRGSENYITGVTHDSRECGKGDLFVAIVGAKMDGHSFIPEVLEAGCRTILISDDTEWFNYSTISQYGAVSLTDDVADVASGWVASDVAKAVSEAIGATTVSAAAAVNVIKVKDTVYAMGELAKYYLASLDVKRVAVTGSVGKTSVRDMTYYILSEKYNCGRNLKNFNNLIGLPLSIFKFDKKTEIVVLEMGMDKFGEIDRLAEIVKPNIAVITNIGMSHIENLGSREGIFKAKMEITNHITSCEDMPGTLIFANDNEFLTEQSTRGDYNQIMVGENGESDFVISDVDDFGLDGIQFTLENSGKITKMNLPVPGIHNAFNSALAIAVGSLLGVDAEAAQQGLEKVELTGSRLKRLQGNGIAIIDDTYNASPVSMKSALTVLESSKGEKRKIAILGDMYELGAESLRQHFAVGAFAKDLDIDILIAIGNDAAEIAEGAAGGDVDVMYYEKKENFYDEMNQIVKFGDIILVKGSRGMKMEQIVKKLLEI